MTALTLNESGPAAQLIARAAAEVILTDAKGRKITLKKPGILAQYRIVDMLGDSAQNQAYMRMVLPLIYVSAIDGEYAPLPATKLQLEALIQGLGEEGVDAVMKGISENFGASSDPEGDKSSIKK